MTQTWDPGAYAQNGSILCTGLQLGVLEWLNAQMGEYILDLGCGDGQLTQRVAATGAHRCIGVDSSTRMVAAARSREKSMPSRQPPNCFLCTTATFDAVFSNAALHWVRDQERHDGAGASRAEAAVASSWLRWEAIETSPQFMSLWVAVLDALRVRRARRRRQLLPDRGVLFSAVSSGTASGVETHRDDSASYDTGGGRDGGMVAHLSPRSHRESAGGYCADFSRGPRGHRICSPRHCAMKTATGSRIMYGCDSSPSRKPADSGDDSAKIAS